MAQIPRKVAARLQAGIKQFQPILASAKARDVNESDTLIIVTDMMLDVLKREIVEGEKAEEARKKISRAAGRALRAKSAKAGRQVEALEPVSKNDVTDKPAGIPSEFASNVTDVD